MQDGMRPCTRAGFPGLLFHDLRRSAVRNMKRAGNPHKAVMEISGHKTRSIFDRYDIVSDADIQSVGQRTAEYLKARKDGAKEIAPGQISPMISPSVVECVERGLAGKPMMLKWLRFMRMWRNWQTRWI